MESNVLESKVTNVIEDIQEQIVMSGGRFFRQREIRNMDVEELLKQLIPNHIVVGFEYESETKPIKKAPAHEKDEDED